MNEQGKFGPILSMLIFGIPFLLIGGLLVYCAAKGQTFAQPLDIVSQFTIGILGFAFFAVGVCATVCAMAGRTRIGRIIAAFLMAAHIGLIGIAFLVTGVFDPQSIKGAISAPFVGHIELNPHFGVGAVVFIIGGVFLLSQIPKIFRTTMMQLDKVIDN